MVKSKLCIYSFHSIILNPREKYPYPLNLSIIERKPDKSQDLTLHDFSTQCFNPKKNEHCLRLGFLGRSFCDVLKNHVMNNVVLICPGTNITALVFIGIGEWEHEAGTYLPHVHFTRDKGM